MQRSWALLVLSVPAPTPEVSQRLGLRHKTVPQRARQLSAIQLTSIGDHIHRVLELGSTCTRQGVRLIAPLRTDAALSAPAPPRLPGTNGRLHVKGERLPQLAHGLKAEQTRCQQVHVKWDKDRRSDLEVTSGTVVWYRIDQQVLAVR